MTVPSPLPSLGLACLQRGWARGALVRGDVNSAIGLTIVKVSNGGVVRVARVEVGHQRGHVLSGCEHPMGHIPGEDEAWEGRGAEASAETAQRGCFLCSSPKGRKEQRRQARLEPLSSRPNGWAQGQVCMKQKGPRPDQVLLPLRWHTVPLPFPSQSRTQKHRDHGGCPHRLELAQRETHTYTHEQVR